MKKILLLAFIFLFIAPKYLNAQKNDATVALAVGGLLAIGSGIAAINSMKEQDAKMKEQEKRLERLEAIISNMDK